MYIHIYIYIHIYVYLYMAISCSSWKTTPFDPMRLSKIRLRCEAIEAIEASRAAEQPPTLTCRRYMADVDHLTSDDQPMIIVCRYTYIYIYRYDYDYPDII